MTALTERPTFQVSDFPIEFRQDIEIEMPRHARILSIQMQGAVPVIWALVCPTEEKEKREFLWTRTGNPISMRRPLQYVGSVQTSEGLIYHMFEKGFLTK